MGSAEPDLTRLVEEAWTSAGQGPVPDVGALRQYISPRFEWHEDPSFPEAGVYRGADAALDYMRQFLSSFSEISYRPVEIKQHGDRVLAKMEITGRGAGSDAPVEITGWWGFVARDGLFLRGYGYIDRGRALEALGLSEEDLAKSAD